MAREQGDAKIHFGSMNNYFGEHQENNSWNREKKVKFQREPGAGDPPLQGLGNEVPLHGHSASVVKHYVSKS